MSECREKLIASNEILTPRSCRTCGHGPCHFPPVSTTTISMAVDAGTVETLDVLAKVIGTTRNELIIEALGGYVKHELAQYKKYRGEKNKEPDQ